MAINFPSNPTIGDIYTFGTIPYEWDGVSWTTGTSSQMVGYTGSQGSQGVIGYTGSSGASILTSPNTFSANQIIDVTDNSNAALRITQRGTGNVLVVEDSASDTTPFVIDQNGNVGIGVIPVASTTSKLQTNSDVVLSGTNRAVMLNTYFDSAWKYAANGYGAYIKNDDTGGGGLVFAVASNNTTGAGSAASMTTAIRVSPSGNVGIGPNVAVAKLDIGASDGADEGAEVKLRGAANASVDWNFDVYQNAFRLFTTDKGAGTNWQGRLSMSHDTGILVQQGSGTFVGHSIRNNSASATVIGHSYVDFQNELAVPTGSIVNVHATDGASRIDIAATPTGTRSSDRRSTVFQIHGNGNVLAINPNGGLGYGTGAGGTVTQATSKSTTVTLNKPTGKITVHNAALAAGGYVEFLFSNSTITADDTVVVNPVAGTYSGAASTYLITAVPGPGYAYIVIHNRSGSSYSEAFQINFAVIKGATS